MAREPVEKRPSTYSDSTPVTILPPDFCLCSQLITVKLALSDPMPALSRTTLDAMVFANSFQLS